MKPVLTALAPNPQARKLRAEAAERVEQLDADAARLWQSLCDSLDLPPGKVVLALNKLTGKPYTTRILAKDARVYFAGIGVRKRDDGSCEVAGFRAHGAGFGTVSGEKAARLVGPNHSFRYDPEGLDFHPVETLKPLSVLELVISLCFSWEKGALMTGPDAP